MIKFFAFFRRSGGGRGGGDVAVMSMEGAYSTSVNRALSSGSACINNPRKIQRRRKIQIPFNARLAARKYVAALLTAYEFALQVVRRRLRTLMLQGGRVMLVVGFRCEKSE
jgi:hypothetical protein